MNILVVNAGSSSLKCQLLSLPSGKMLAKGSVEDIGPHAIVKVDGASIRKKISSHQFALTQILTYLDTEKIDAIAHRVVHGGEKYSAPTKITASVIREIEKLSTLAPLHNPANVQGIKACKKLFPKLHQVAVFDTAFHQSIPQVAYTYAIPMKYYKKYGVRKYGFHGSSHEYILHKTKKILKKSTINIISAHLGNGSSVCAIKNNKSIETSMGFTPLSGLIMGTRSGDIDPSIIFFLAKHEKLSLDQIDTLLNKKSGLLGVDGHSSMKDIFQRSKKGKGDASLAINMLAYQLAKYIASYYVVLGKVDAIVFTGGLGENAYYVRKKVMDYLAPLGIKLDAKQNRKNAQKISQPSSKLKVFVLETNEELMIARHAQKILKK